VNRIWPDRRPEHLRYVVGWWEWHYPRLVVFRPGRCRKCKQYGYNHNADCPALADIESRQTVHFWRAMALATVPAVLFYGAVQLLPLFIDSVAVAVAVILGLVALFCVFAHFLISKWGRDWWNPKR
jgi:hypothetical protein